MTDKLTKSQVLFESIMRLMRRGATGPVRRLLQKSHPSEIASVIRQLSDDDGQEIFRQIPGKSLQADTLVELEGAFLQNYLGGGAEKTAVAELLGHLAEDESAKLLSELGEDDQQEILGLMKVSVQEDVAEILEYEEDSCGRIMAVNPLALNQNLTARQAIEEIQNTDSPESLFYIYVIDDYENLMGVVSLRQVLQVEKNKKLSEFMTRDTIHVTVNDTEERAAEYIEEYNFVSLPVVDTTGKLVGMITVDDIIDFIRDEAQDDVLQFAGAEKEAIDDFSFWRAFVSRGVWYGLLFLGGILSSEIIMHFFARYHAMVAVFAFAPLVLRLSGSVTTQTAAFTDQSLLSDDIERGRASRALWGQNSVSFTVGLLLAGAVWAYLSLRFPAGVLGHGLLLGLPLGIVLMDSVAIALGMLIPTVFNVLKMDPLPASSRFIHFLMDGITLLIFFVFVFLWNEHVQVF